MKRGNGEGTIYYSESRKSWVGQVVSGRTPDGKPIRVTRYGKTKKEVHDKLVQVEVTPQIEKNNTTFGELALKVLMDKKNANIIADVTYNRDRGTLKIIEKHYIWDMQIQKITSSDITAFINSTKAYSNATISKIMIQLKLVFRTAVELDLIIKDPMLSVRKPKSEKIDVKVEALTIEEQKLFVENCNNEPYRNIIMILLYTGMRVGEVLALTTDDINLEKNEIYIRKSLTKDKNSKSVVGKTTKTYSSMRTIPITNLNRAFFIDTLENYTPNSQKLVFGNSKRKCYSTRFN